MEERNRKGKAEVWRCTKRSSRKEISVRVRCLFFSTNDENVKRRSALQVIDVLEIIWLLLHTQCAIRQAAKATQHSTATIVRWWHTCRSVCSMAMDLEPKFEGTPEKPIQVNESFFLVKESMEEDDFSTVIVAKKMMLESI